MTPEGRGRGRPRNDDTARLDPPPDAYTVQAWPDGNFPPEVLEGALKQVNYDAKRLPIFVNGWYNFHDRTARRFTKWCETNNIHLPNTQALVQVLFGQRAFDELWPTYVDERGPLMNTVDYAQRHSIPPLQQRQEPLADRMAAMQERMMEKKLEMDMVKKTLGLDSHETHTSRQQVVPVMRRKIPTTQPDGSVVEIIEEVEMPQMAGQYPPGFGAPQQPGMSMETMMVAMAGMVGAVATAVKPGGNENGQPPPDPFDQMEKMSKAFKNMRGENTGEEGSANFWMTKSVEMQKTALDAQTAHLSYVAGEAVEDRNALASEVHKLKEKENRPIQEKVQEMAQTVDALKTLTGQGNGETTFEERQQHFDFSVRKWEQGQEDVRTDRLINGIEKVVSTPLQIISEKAGEAIGDSIAQRIGGPTGQEETEIDQAIYNAERELLSVGGDPARAPSAPPAPSPHVARPSPGPRPGEDQVFIDDEFAPISGVDEEVAILNQRRQERSEGWL